jgi:hypothetical protein
MVDFDNVFKFCTPKYVMIRDAKLGLLKYALMLFIFCYVVVYNIFYSCLHLKKHHAQGFGTMSIQHPMDKCDDLGTEKCKALWENVKTLPYCLQYEGDEADINAAAHDLTSKTTGNEARMLKEEKEDGDEQTHHDAYHEKIADEQGVSKDELLKRKKGHFDNLASGGNHSTNLCEKYGGMDHWTTGSCCQEDCGKLCGHKDCWKAPKGGCCESTMKHICSDKHQAPCKLDLSETAAPTEAPTEAPTAAPTEAPTAAPTEAPTAAPRKKKGVMCRYMDARRLEWASGAPSEIFIPTRYRQIKQKLNPDCYNPTLKGEGSQLHTDPKKYRCQSPYTTVSEDEFYIADIEEYTLKLSHSFSAPDAGLYGVSTDYQGVFAVCPDNHPADIKEECRRAKVPNTSGDMAPEDEEGLESAKDLAMPSLHGEKTGEDAISVRDFLSATPIAQENPDLKGHLLDSQLPDSFGHPGKTLRQMGGMLLLDVDYDNFGYLRPGIPGLPSSMDIKPVTYSYRPYFVATNKNTRYQLMQGSHDSETRIVDIWYGVTIKMQFNGQLVMFSFTGLLKALTAGLVLLSAATSLVVALAAYVMPLNEKYNGVMYQMSEDLSPYSDHRAPHVGGCGKLMNPLGMCDAKQEFQDREHTFPTSEILLDKLGGEISNEEIIKILCMAECRLNRLDAMDTRMKFDGENPDADKNHKVGKLVLGMMKDYYKQKPAE